MPLERKLTYWAACIALGHADAFMIKSWTEELMEAGEYHDEYLPIIDASPPTLTEVQAPFVKVLASLGYPLPDPKVALREIIAHHTADIASGRVDPMEGLERLFQESIVWDQQRPNWGSRRLDEHDAFDFEVLYWAIDEQNERAFDEDTRLRADAEVAVLLEEVRQEAIRWQSAHGGK